MLAARGKTVLLTIHYLEEADALAHRIVVINKGRVVSEGTPTEIKRMSGGRQIRCTTTLTTEFLRTLPSVTSVIEDRIQEISMSATTTPYPAAASASLPRIYLKETKYEFLKLLRTRSFSIATIGFPVMFYLLFGVANKHTVAGGINIAKYMMAGYACFGLRSRALWHRRRHGRRDQCRMA